MFAGTSQSESQKKTRSWSARAEEDDNRGTERKTTAPEPNNAKLSQQQAATFCIGTSPVLDLFWPRTYCFDLFSPGLEPLLHWTTSTTSRRVGIKCTEVSAQDAVLDVALAAHRRRRHTRSSSPSSSRSRHVNPPVAQRTPSLNAPRPASQHAGCSARLYSTRTRLERCLKVRTCRCAFHVTPPVTSLSLSLSSTPPSTPHSRGCRGDVCPAVPACTLLARDLGLTTALITALDPHRARATHCSGLRHVTRSTPRARLVRSSTISLIHHLAQQRINNNNNAAAVFTSARSTPHLGTTACSRTPRRPSADAPSTDGLDCPAYHHAGRSACWTSSPSALGIAGTVLL
ncbi:hypothetical protein C8R45DRAFT_1101109 [Mycena sanguinolenta]|nr:hypothetical protein C8R45DRAFT_1101109 [Mycena sanguinolenta]